MFAFLPILIPLRQVPIYVTLLLTYLILVRLLRYRRARGFEARYAPAGRVNLATLSNKDAQAVLQDLTELEFPKIFGFSIVFALFKVRPCLVVPDAMT